jgi:hypothetical protein
VRDGDTVEGRVRPTRADVRVSTISMLQVQVVCGGVACVVCVCKRMSDGVVWHACCRWGAS